MEKYRMLAEWEPQSMVQLTWPHKDTDWAPMLDEITATYVEMAREISRREGLLIVVPSRDDLPQEVLQMDNVTIVECRTNDTWARDHGLLSLVEEPHPLPPLLKARGTLKGEGEAQRQEESLSRVEGARIDLPHENPCDKLQQERLSSFPRPHAPSIPRLMLLDFKFNGWGEKFEAEKDNAINKKLWEQLFSRTDGAARADESLLSVCRVATEVDRRSESRVEYESHLDFVLEGGSIESDGKGTIFTTSCCLLAPNRNEGLAGREPRVESRKDPSPTPPVQEGSLLRVEDQELKEWIESELKRRLRAERIVWLDATPMEGDDTDGHIDTMVRIAPNDTILYNCDETMRRQLEQLRTLEGNPYRLIELPLPEPIWSRVESRGSRVEQLPATYANYLVLNGAVLVPTYAQPDNDKEAMRLIATAFPDREIIGIDSRSIIKQHGSIHCCTMQYY